MLTAREYEDILFFVSSIQSENVLDFRHMVLRLLNVVFGYPHLTFFLSNEKGMLVDPVVLNMSDESLSDYNKYYFQTDIFHPINGYQKLLIQKDVITITDLMSYEDFEQTEFYNAFLKKYNLYYMIVMPLKVGSQIIGGIGISRPLQHGDFIEKDKLILDRLNKYISHFLWNYLNKLKLENEKQAIINSIQHLPVGLIILDSKFSLLHANKMAEDYCMDIVNKNSSNSLAHVINLLSLEYFGKSLKTTFYIKSYLFQLFPILVPSDQTSINSIYCVYISDQQNIDDNNIDDNESLYMLTEREKEITDLLAKGFSNKDIAKTLYLSTHTVRTHLKNIFQKVEATSRVSPEFRRN
ncbi:MAG TPA: helix-turn-helix transcriptional regulator [Pseudobacteroides sp.]|uniref:response regulator transcription factor n=1 Tax=Pseudobacteroides sp. TaxID=1968840 RepID=UPI002F939427